MAKAERMYFMVLKLLDDQACMEMQRMAKLLKLASLNNLYQIHCLNGDHGKARDCLTCLRMFLQQNASEAFMDEPELKDMLANVFLLQMQHNVAPAA